MVRTLYVSFARRLDKEEINLIRIPSKKRQKGIRFTWKKEEMKNE